MTHDEYLVKVKELEEQLSKVTDEYVNSNKIYNVGDYLRVTFPKCTGEKVTSICRIKNIYPSPTQQIVPSLFERHPKGYLEYFARFVCKDSKGIFETGVCYLGPLSNCNNVCGYANVDWNKVKIEVIKESEI